MAEIVREVCIKISTQDRTHARATQTQLTSSVPQRSHHSVREVFSTHPHNFHRCRTLDLTPRQHAQESRTCCAPVRAAAESAGPCARALFQPQDRTGTALPAFPQHIRRVQMPLPPQMLAPHPNVGLPCLEPHECWQPRRRRPHSRRVAVRLSAKGSNRRASSLADERRGVASI